MTVSIIVVQGNVTTNPNGTLTVPATHAIKTVSNDVGAKLAERLELPATPVGLLSFIALTLKREFIQARVEDLLAQQETVQDDASTEFETS